ncbi:MAG: hypothetical protein ACI9OJ_004795, partial [Myxococcota bacterium]
DPTNQQPLPPAKIQAIEMMLDARESELSVRERALDGTWSVHEDRLRVLADLEDYVRDQEQRLIGRAARLQLPLDAIVGAEPDQSLSVAGESAGRERREVLEHRESLCAVREAALERRRALLVDAAAEHMSREDALLDREAQLAEAFRGLITGRRTPANRSTPGELHDGGPDTTAPQQAMASPELVALEPEFGPDVQPMGELTVVAALSPPAPALHPIMPTEGCSDSETGRRFRRIELSVAVDFGTDHNFFAGQTENLGVGGLFIATNNLLQAGRIVRLRLALPDEGTLEIDGEVAWRRPEPDDEGPMGLGIRFMELTVTTREAIEAFVHRRDPLPAPQLLVAT